MANLGAPLHRVEPTTARATWPAGSPLSILKCKPRGFEFKAEVDASEINDKGLPGPPWACRSLLLSKGMIVLHSRRMIHLGKQVAVAVHRIDDEPVALLGRVGECEYHADGQHVIMLELLPITDPETMSQWVRDRARQRPKS